ncbi:hypothetical protein JCGZ_19815 [Jatropha curcas]|uniref:Uncharacterized protein n=1 Tax=Jatropha curcas TaxID=180498 RepID=A0A067K6K4_JATCU|nr:hypothetical protein JCGZ_19815 [Jatropha curcas]
MELAARDADLEKLKEENWDLLNKNKDLEDKVKEMGQGLEGFRTRRGSVAEDLAKACLSLRKNVLTEPQTRHPDLTWSWVNDIYPDEDEGEEDVKGDNIVQDRKAGGSPPPRIGIDVSADIHPISFEGQGTLKIYLLGRMFK